MDGELTIVDDTMLTRLVSNVDQNQTDWISILRPSLVLRKDRDACEEHVMDKLRSLFFIFEN